LSELVQLVDTVEDNLSLKESIITEAPNWNADQIKDPYELLGVSEDDDQETIRKHAKNLSDQHPNYHSDINSAVNSIDFSPGDESRTGTGREEIRLSVTVETAPVTSGKPVQFAVEDANGDPVEDVTIETDGGKRAQTDDAGRATLVFDSVGQASLKATKKDVGDVSYRDDTETVTVTKSKRTLQATVANDDVLIGDSLTVRVTEKKTGDTVSGATVEIDSRSEKTDESGEATIPLNAGGQFKLIVSKPDESDVSYESYSTRVSVQKRRDALNISIQNEVIVGKDVRLQVTSQGGSPVEEAVLYAKHEDERNRSQLGRTEQNGTLTTRFDNTGSWTLRAEKESQTTEYESAEGRVDVSEPTKSLFVECSQMVSAGDPVTMKVTDNHGTPVENAVVKGMTNTGIVTDTTDSRGEASITFPEPGIVNITAAKDGFPEFNSTRTIVK
jgi:protocatechuate 3,4-dioxygenase beta subunit